MTIIPSRARRLAPRCVDGCQWNMYGEAGLSSSCHFCPSFLNYAHCHYNSDAALFNTSQSNQPGHGRPRRRHASLQHTHTHTHTRLFAQNGRLPEREKHPSIVLATRDRLTDEKEIDRRNTELQINKWIMIKYCLKQWIDRHGYY